MVQILCIFIHNVRQSTTIHDLKSRENENKQTFFLLLEVTYKDFKVTWIYLYSRKNMKQKCFLRELDSIFRRTKQKQLEL